MGFLIGRQVMFVVALLGAFPIAKAQTSAAETRPPKENPSVNVFGAVGRPGRIFFPPGRDLTIVDAISSAGGASRSGNIKEVKLTRKSPTGESITTIIDVNAVMEASGDGRPVLENGDLVYVPELPPSLDDLLARLASPNLKDRDSAGFLLRDRNGLTEEHLDALISACRQGNGWTPAAIARVGTPRAIAFLVEAIKDVPHEGAAGQLNYAFKIAGEKGAVALAEVFAERQPPGNVSVICHVFFELGATARVAVPRLTEIACDRSVSSAGRLGAVSALGSIGESAVDAVPKLKQLAQSELGRFTNAVGDAIVQTGAADGARFLAARLREPSSATAPSLTRMAQLKDLASLRQNGREAGPEVLALLHDENWETRVHAARALGFIDYTPATEALTRLLSTQEDWRLVCCAAESLGRIGASSSLAELNAVADHHWFPVVRDAARKATRAIEGKESYSRLPSSRFGYEFLQYTTSAIDWGLPRSPLASPPFAPEPEELGAAELARISYPFGTPSAPTCGLRVGNGLLLGRYGGEWGGELAYQDGNGKLHVAKRWNTLGLHRMAFGIVALNSDRISRVTVDRNGTVSVEPWRILPGPMLSRPQSGLLENGSLYVACMGGDILVTPSGNLKMADAGNASGLIQTPSK